MGPKKAAASKPKNEIPDEFKKQPTLLQQCPTVQTITVTNSKLRPVVEPTAEPPLTDMEVRPAQQGGGGASQSCVRFLIGCATDPTENSF